MDAVGADAEGLAQPSTEEVRLQLQRILESRDFAASERCRALLSYVVAEALAGRAKRLKGVAIAMSVFDRDETFDPQNDPVVRLEARRLRRDLDGYYASAGRNDEVRISIPKGSYVPLFEWQEGVGREVTEVPLGAEETVPLADNPKLTGMRPRRGILLGAIFLALIVAATAVWHFFGPESREPTVALLPDEVLLAIPKGPMIAVLPFIHQSGDPERQYVADGITEQLTTELARFRDLWVLPLGTMRKYQAGSADPRELHREFGADYALEGSVLEIGNTIRITARLIDVSSARYIWVKSYDAAFTPSSIYEAQDAITLEVAGSLAGKHGVIAQNDMVLSKRKAPDSLDAYDCVLRFYDNNTSFRESRHAEVRVCLEQAVVLDPGYAEAWAVLAYVYLQEIHYKLIPKDAIGDVLKKAKAAAKRAIYLDPADPTGHMMLSNLLFSEGDFIGFKQEGETALRLNPNNSEALAHYGMRIAFRGGWDLGLPLVKKATTLNPGHPDWYRFPEVFYRYDRGEYQRALAELDKIDLPNFLWTNLLRVAILGQLDRSEAARAAVQELLRLRPAFRQEALSLIKVWHFPEPLYQSIVVGLHKAGLELTTKVSKQAN